MKRWGRQASLSGLALAALAGPAFSQTFAYNGNTSSPVDYATQSVLSNTTVITAAAASITSPELAAGVTTDSTVTFTLPPGAIFASAPTAVCTVEVPANANCQTGGISGVGTNTLTVPFQYTVLTSTTALTVRLQPGWKFSGAGALGTPVSNPLLITEQSNDTNFSTTPLTAQFAESASALAFTSSPPQNSLVVNLNSPALGRQFLQNGASNPTTADVGSVQLQNNPNVVDATNSTFTFPDGATVTISGLFGGIGFAFLTQPGTLNCNSGTDVFNGAFTNTSLPFPGVGIGLGKPAQEVCLVATQTSIIQANPANLTATASIPGTGSTAPTDQNATLNSGGLASYNYNGMVQQLLYSGNLLTADYDYTVRVVNNTPSPVPLIAVVQADNGAEGSAILQPIPGKTNVFIQAFGIVAAAGIGPGPVSILMLAPGATPCVNGIDPTGNTGGGPACPVSISGVMTNGQNGTVVQIGSGTSP